MEMFLLLFMCVVGFYRSVGAADSYFSFNSSTWETSGVHSWRQKIGGNTTSGYTDNSCEFEMFIKLQTTCLLFTVSSHKDRIRHFFLLCKKMGKHNSIMTMDH